MANTSTGMEIKILFLYLIVTYIDRQEALDIPSYAVEQFVLGSDVWAKAKTILALLSQTRLKLPISGQSRNKARVSRLDGFLRSVSKCHISEHQG
jgi:hypothetical protein